MSDTRTPPNGATPLDKSGHTTFHLVPAAYWTEWKEQLDYLPERFDEEGFIHCTDSIEEVIAVGNRYYQSDARDYLLLEIDCGSVAAPIVYEDAGRIFPHIYGPLDVAAVRRVLQVEREPDGRFVSIEGD